MTNGPFESRAAESADGNPRPWTDWREYYLAVRQGFLIVLLCLALGALGAALYLSRQEARFQAGAVLVVNPDQSGEQGFTFGGSGLTLRCLDRAERVSQRLRLSEDPGFPALSSKGSGITHSEAAGAIVGHVTFKIRRGTRLIDISVTHPDPAHAIRMASTYADEFMRDSNDGERILQSKKLLRNEADRLQWKLLASHEAMESLRQRDPTATMDGPHEEYDNLNRELEADWTTFTAVMERIKENDLMSGTINPLSLHERAAIATPVDIGTRKIYIRGGLLGLAVGLGIIFIRHFSGQSIKSAP